MFVRPCWEPKTQDDAFGLIDRNPWAMLVSNGVDGPQATNLPLLRLDPATDPVGKVNSEDTRTVAVLEGHIARANDHLETLRQEPDNVLAIFEGPWSYVTASWYPDRQMPSTYYYTAVHCYGSLEFKDETALDASLESLIERMEMPFLNGWRSNEIARSEITRRFAGITGFRLHVSSMQAKFKLGQDEPLRDALAVAAVLDSHESVNDRILAELIREQNAGRS